MKKQIRETIGVGIGTMAGMGALGIMKNVSGMPPEAGNAANIGIGGLGLIGTAQLAKNAMFVGKSISGGARGRKWRY